MRSFLLSSFLVLGCLHLGLPASAQTSETTKKKQKTTGASASHHDEARVSNGSYLKGKQGKPGETVYITTDDNGLRLKLVTQGAVTMAEDERSIATLSEGGRFEFARQEKAAPEHKVILKNKDGRLEGNYWVDGEAQDYATAGQAWLAEYLPELVSKTGLGAEARAERLYREGGAQKLLAHTASMESGTGRTKMYRYLMAKEELKTGEMRLVLEQIARVKISDYETASILTKIPTNLLADAGTAEAYATASATISSDYEKGRALKHLLKHENLSERALDKVAEAMKTIDSNYEKVKILNALAARPALSEKQFNWSMQALQKVSSDYERTKGLGAFMRHEQQVVAYFDKVLPLINSIGSDYEKAKAYSSLLGNSRLSTNQYLPLLKASEGIGSDYEKAKLLRKMALQPPKDNDKIKEAYSQAAKTVGSKYEYEKVMAAY